jgi:hypothetical protein
LLEASHPADAVLAVDPDMPYRIVSQVLIRLGFGHVSGFHFLATYDTHPGLALGSVDVYPPTRGSDGFPVTNPSAPIEVRLRPQSMALTGNGKSVPDGCGEMASVGGETPYDFAALTRCGTALKKADGLSDDLMLIVSPEVRFQTVISTMDALAHDYPHVRFGVMR